VLEIDARGGDEPGAHAQHQLFLSQLNLNQHQQSQAKELGNSKNVSNADPTLPLSASQFLRALGQNQGQSLQQQQQSIEEKFVDL